jgi:hypothetical protein
MILTLWLLCGLVSSVVAINKGRSGCGWFMLGIMLGPLGFALTLLVPPNRAAIEEHALKAGDLKMCQHCARLISSDATTCGFCGEVAVPEVRPDTRSS